MKENKSVNIRKKSKWSNYTTGDKVFLIIVYTTLIVVALVCIYPLYLTVISSISDPREVAKGRVNLFPRGFTWEAYQNVFENKSIWLGYANTIFYTVVGTIFNLILTIPTAYALSKKRMFGRGFIMTIFLITMYFGGGLVPTYMLYDKLELINTRWVLILSGGLSVYNVIVTRTYFQNNVPDSLYEAGKIDGASEIKMFLKIAIPLSAPILAVITLFYAVGHWSAYFNAMIYISDMNLHPLQVVLRRILILNENFMATLYSEDGITDDMIALALKRAELAYTMKYAVVFIASLPMLIAYPFIQKYFVKGMMIGALKG